jgi:alpha-glucosidase
MKKQAHKTITMIVLALGTFLWTIPGSSFAEEFQLNSPDGKLQVTISIEQDLRYSASLGNKQILAPSPLTMTVEGHGVLGKSPKLKSSDRRSANQILKPVVPVKSKEIVDNYQEIVLDFEEGYSLDFRAYDDAVAYRFRTRLPGEITVISELVTLNFPDDHPLYFPTEESFLTHSERLYEYESLSKIPWEKMAHLPILVDGGSNLKLAFTEADLFDYPGLYLRGTRSTALRGKFPAYALKEIQTRDRTVEVAERADFIARTKGDRPFPWRVLVVAQNDGQLLTNQTVFKLARPLQIKDPSWIKPGKVAWDWWNANNVFNVPFTAGINTETYKYYIDFASRYGIEYIILDEGWSDTTNLLKVNPDINMPELLAHAKAKNVGVILWVVWKTLDDQLQEALDLFRSWDIKGIKVDFMQRDDQWMVNYYWRIAEEAAKRQMLVDFHGSYKPSGLRRAYPNVLTREGVKGLENTKWSKQPSPEHDLILPFTRMLAGPMDYTPGAMINAQEKNFRSVFTRPMSLGTRCHQLALYVVFESPLQMLCDSPSHYLREPGCMEFLGPVPAVWDETRVLAAKVGDYIVIARKSGHDWYLGALTDGTPRALTIDFSFLDTGEYTIEFYRDGANAGRYGNDYVKQIKKIDRNDTWNIQLAPGGGWAARIYE